MADRTGSSAIGSPQPPGPGFDTRDLEPRVLLITNDLASVIDLFIADCLTDFLRGGTPGTKHTEEASGAKNGIFGWNAGYFPLRFRVAVHWEQASFDANRKTPLGWPWPFARRAEVLWRRTKRCQGVFYILPSVFIAFASINGSSFFRSGGSCAGKTCSTLAKWLVMHHRMAAQGGSHSDEEA